MTPPGPGQYSDAYTWLRQCSAMKQERETHLFLDGRLKVLVLAKVDGDDSFLQTVCLNLVLLTRYLNPPSVPCLLARGEGTHSRNDSIRHGETFLEGHLGRLNDMVREEGRPGSSFWRRLPAGELLDPVEVDGEDSSAVVCQQGCERSSYDFRSDT